MRIQATLSAAMVVVSISVACSVGAQSSTPFSPKTEQGDITIVRDGQVSVRYRFNGPLLQFYSELPAGWSFKVVVDSDQNGVWGSGFDLPTQTLRQSPDFLIGQHSKNGIFCGAYVLTASSSDPAQIFAATDCDGFQTGGTVTISQMTQKQSAEITYNVPTSVIFGKNDTIRLQICVWDTKRSQCYFSPAQPYVIKKSAGNAGDSL